jgi:hypothetical protein
VGKYHQGDSEGRVTARCAQLYSAVGGKVYWLSQRRPSGQSAGLPDLIVVFRGRAVIVHEAKRPEVLRHRGQGLSAEQAELREMLAGIPGVKHVLGGFDEAWQALQDLGYTVSGLSREA